MTKRKRTTGSFVSAPAFTTIITNHLCERDEHSANVIERRIGETNRFGWKSRFDVADQSEYDQWHPDRQA